MWLEISWLGLEFGLRILYEWGGLSIFMVRLHYIKSNPKFFMSLNLFKWSWHTRIKY